MLKHGVQETTLTTGTGTVTLTSVSTYSRFADRFSVGALADYEIKAVNGDREWGIGTVGAGNTLARTIITGTLVGGVYTPSDTPLNLAAGATVSCVEHEGSAHANNILQYGADMTGATDSTAAINAAIAALPATGGYIFIPPGILNSSGGHVSNVPINLIGAGMGMQGSLIGGVTYNEAITWIKCSSGNTPFLTVNANSSSFEKFRLTCTNAAPVAGSAGILVGAKGSHFSYDRIMVDGFYINIDHQYGRYWVMDRCILANPWYVDLQIQDVNIIDEGDCTITNSFFLAGTAAQSPHAAILWKSGGGMKLIGNKTNVGPNSPGSLSADFSIFKIGVHIQPINSNTATGVILIENNSLESQTGAAVLIDFSLATAFNLIKGVISGNETLRLGPQASDKYAFQVIGNTNSYIDQFIINENVVGNYQSIVHIENAKNCYIGVNMSDSLAPGTAAVSIGNNTTNVVRMSQQVTTNNATVGGNSVPAGNAERSILVQLPGYNDAVNHGYDEYTARISNAYQGGFWSGAISGVTYAANVLTVTAANHKFSNGDIIYVTNVVSSGSLATVMNGKYMTASNVVANTSFNLLAMSTPTGAYTSGGTATSEGALFEIVGHNAMSAFTFELEVLMNLLAGTTIPCSASIKRTVIIDNSGVANVAIVGSDAGMVGVPTYITAGTSPGQATAVTMNGGAATALVTNPVFSSITAGAGVGLEILIESSVLGSPGNIISTGTLVSRNSLSIYDGTNGFLRAIATGDWITPYSTSVIKKVAFMIDDNNFVVDSAWTPDLTVTGYTNNSQVSYNKTRILVRPINNSGLVSGRAKLKIIGAFDRLSRIAP